MPAQGRLIEFSPSLEQTGDWPAPDEAPKVRQADIPTPPGSPGPAGQREDQSAEEPAPRPKSRAQRDIRSFFSAPPQGGPGEQRGADAPQSQRDIKAYFYGAPGRPPDEVVDLD